MSGLRASKRLLKRQKVRQREPTFCVRHARYANYARYMHLSAASSGEQVWTHERAATSAQLHSAEYHQ